VQVERDAAVRAVAHELGTNGEDAARALAQHLGRERGAPQPWTGLPGGMKRAGGGDDGRQPDRRPTRQDLIDEIDEAVKKLTLSHGAGQLGRASHHIRLRFTRTLRGPQERAGQTLSHLSLMMHDTIRALNDANGSTAPNDREVQGMLINNRLVFASNHDTSMDLLAGHAARLVQTNVRPTLDQLLHPRSGARGNMTGPDRDEYNGRLTRAIAKTGLAEQGLRDNPTARVLQRRGEVTFVDLNDPALRSLLVDPQHAGRIIMLRHQSRSERSMHAEQRLLIAMRNTGLRPEDVSGPHVIMGKYRPCLGCWAALQHYGRSFTGLHSNPNFGHYYRESVNTIASHLPEAFDDPHFRQSIPGALQQRRLASASALSRQQPPEHAVDNHGPEIIIPAPNAPVHGYVTASDSEHETKFDQGTNTTRPIRTRRKLDMTFRTDSGTKNPGHRPTGRSDPAPRPPRAEQRRGTGPPNGV
jgi:hypothetical protein